MIRFAQTTICFLLFAPVLAWASKEGPYRIAEIMPQEPQITQAEWQQLQTGALIFRPGTSNLLGGMAIAYIPLSPKQIFAAATDYEHYDEFMPDTVSCHLQKKAGDGVYHIAAVYKSAWPFDDIILDTINIHDESDPKNLKMTWKVNRTNLRTAYGYWVMQEYHEGSLVFYEMNFDIPWVPHFLAKTKGEKRVLEVIQAVITRARAPHS